MNVSCLGSMGTALNYFCSGAHNGRRSTTGQAILAVLVVVAIAPPAFGQAAGDPPVGRVFAGYSFASQGPVTLHGWHASVFSQVRERVGILMDFSGHYVSSDSSVLDLLDEVDFDVPDNADFGFYTYRFGPQIKIFEGSAVTTFAQILVGGNYVQALGVDESAGVHGFALAAGGGADWNISESLAFRIPQFDYSLVRVGGGTLGGFRVSTGLVFRFR